MADLDPKDDLGGKKEEQGGLGFRGGEEGAEGQSKHKAAAASGGGGSMETAEDEDIAEDRGWMVMDGISLGQNLSWKAPLKA